MSKGSMSYYLSENRTCECILYAPQKGTYNPNLEDKIYLTGYVSVDAEISVVHPDTIKNLKLVPARQAVPSVYMLRDHEAPIYELFFSIKGIYRNSYPVPIMVMEMLAPYKFIIGINALIGFKLTCDFPKNKFWLESSKH